MLPKRLLLLVLAFLSITPASARSDDPPIYIAFLWHMHQPKYWPGESVVQTEANGRYDYSVIDIHDQRTGPYTSWPANAVWQGIQAGLGNLGAQVSFSGSLIENLDDLQAAGNGNFLNWKASWLGIRAQSTALGNPRMDLVGFGYHHPLMPLLDAGDVQRQIQDHKAIFATAFGGAYSKGIFPPENAFAPRIIPALVAEGLEWVLVDNIHFERAAANYPYSTGGNLYEPNAADVRNPDPGDWVALTGLWAPTPVSGRWGHQPHYVEYVDPDTGVASRIIAVPTDRYMGNEDGRGGFGALNYETVISQLEPYNTDPAHPILVVLHHDGDNYGGGSESYYNNNFAAFVSWLQANPTRFVCTTIEDYLELHPPDPIDVIHVENGSWSGADNGDPEFAKWLGDPVNGYSPDRNSWAVVTAAKNWVDTARQIDATHPATAEAEAYLLNAQASDYWYWDGAQNGIWDAHPTRAANAAVAQASLVAGTDQTPPTIFAPQREPYNPGGTEWGIAQPGDFEVWTYVYDRSGLSGVTLHYRVDADGVITVENQVYAGGAGVATWTSVAMTASDVPSQTDPQPTHRAQRFAAQIAGLQNAMVDYYVSANDAAGHQRKSPIEHVWVGDGSGGGSAGAVSWDPQQPQSSETVTITVAGATMGAKLHWGVNGFQTPATVYWPAGTIPYVAGDAVETPFLPGPEGLQLTLGPFDDPSQAVQRVDFVLHYDDGTWDNNGGADYRIDLAGTSAGFDIDGQLDAIAQSVSGASAVELWYAYQGGLLYLATQAASTVGQDVFLVVAESPGALGVAPWAKAGQVAAWDAFVGNESGNNWSGWFDQQGAARVGAGSYLEATLDLAGEFGAVPSQVHVAVLRYATSDGGALLGQFPTGDGNATVEAFEFHALDLGVTSAPPAASSLMVWPPRPNPFNPSTTIRFELAAAGPVRLWIFDAAGRLVETLVHGPRAAGAHEVRFTPRDLASGVYFYRLEAAGGIRTGRLVLLK